MQRNEDVCLDPWLIWHGHLFGHENLFVVDHGSDHPAVLESLLRAEARGTHVVRLPAAADYRLKGDFVTQVLRYADDGAHEFLIPLDCDEFVTMREADATPCARREEILAYIGTLYGEVFEVRENFLNMLGHPELFFALPYQKVFFRRGAVRALDHGSHNCTDKADDAPVPTRLVYTHYHHKSFARQREMSLEKLRPYVDVTDRDALAAYRGIGWHLVAHVLKTEVEYRAIMTPDSRCINFPGIGVQLRQLGIEPDFCDHA